LLLLAGTGAWAQKIAVVDLQAAVLKTKDGEKARGEMNSKFGPKEQDINKRNQDLAAKAEQYRKDSAGMTDAARASTERELQSLQTALKRDSDDAQSDVQVEENRLFGGIFQKMQAVLQKYAADNRIIMIVDLSSQPNNLLFASKSTDITDDVVAIYDKTAAAPAAAPKAPAATAPKPPATAAPKPSAPAAGATPAKK
jgi:outer membrane protein